MIIFLNDRPIKIIREKDFERTESTHFDQILDLRLSKLKTLEFLGHVLLLNVTASNVAQIFDYLENHRDDLLSVTLVTTNKKEVSARIKSLYKVLKAAGGVVIKKDQWLLMYRRKKWDLPKGKLDRGESSRKAAVREIEEETGVKAVIRQKLCTTWHTYTFQNSRILKRTKWYLLDCQDDEGMCPQADEDIELLEWLSFPDVQKKLVNSFSSIRYVAEVLNSMQKEARTM
ncbi:NUDIX hydrolase [Arundinibacter roseus]|uniref:NUDIX domain-containing protein n=1 Tax=Arundinibacter roseus TaxID=2070510 RepID=A0A4R4K9V9_9BACT|nr:NUDIX domain-containing protein [Arundinibacter roseus]TDB64510.1 NUDIX domain-containing protein [Arundinibacter roseus]